MRRVTDTPERLALRVARFYLLLFLGLLAGVELTHILEWPGKLRLTGPEWLAVQNHLYGGYATFGAVAELSTFVISAVIAVVLLLQRDSRGVVFAFVAAAVAAMLVIFALGLQPINLEVAAMHAGSLPPDWPAILNRWSTLHTICFALATAAFAVLLAQSTLVSRSGRH